MKIRDVSMVEEFYDDYAGAPNQVKKRVDNKIRIMGEAIQTNGWCHLPNSFNAHKVDNVPDLWIGYITVGNQGWRVLFDVDVKGTLRFLHLLSHDNMDFLLMQLQRWET